MWHPLNRLDSASDRCQHFHLTCKIICNRILGMFNVSFIIAFKLRSNIYWFWYQLTDLCVVATLSITMGRVGVGGIGVERDIELDSRVNPE